jgi:hypothetical protein
VNRGGEARADQALRARGFESDIPSACTTPEIAKPTNQAWV